MQNKVIAGDFEGWSISKSMSLFGAPRFYLTNVWKKEEFSKATVARYDIIDRNNVASFGRAIIYGAAGQTLFGPVGMIAGILGGSRGKETYVISIELNNGKKALLEVDKNMYREIIRVLY